MFNPQFCRVRFEVDEDFLLATSPACFPLLLHSPDNHKTRYIHLPLPLPSPRSPCPPLVLITT